MAEVLPDLDPLIELLGVDRRVVVLVGLGFARDHDAEQHVEGGDWARRGNLEALLTDPAAFWEFYLPLATEIAARTPSAGHTAIAQLQRAGVIWKVIAQSADRLLTKAGVQDVVEVHGNVVSSRCDRCGERYGIPEVEVLIGSSPDGVPRCTTDGCGYPVRPSGTLWGETLPEEPVRRAWALAAEAKTFMVCDSSLRTTPVSLLPSVPLTRGIPLAIVGRTATQYDRYATVIQAPAEPVMVALAARLAPGT